MRKFIKEYIGFDLIMFFVTLILFFSVFMYSTYRSEAELSSDKALLVAKYHGHGKYYLVIKYMGQYQNTPVTKIVYEHQNIGDTLRIDLSSK